MDNILLDLHNSSDDTQTLNSYHRHTHVHLLPIIVWSVQVIYINLGSEYDRFYVDEQNLKVHLDKAISPERELGMDGYSQ